MILNDRSIKKINISKKEEFEMGEEKKSKKMQRRQPHALSSAYHLSMLGRGRRLPGSDGGDVLDGRCGCC